MSLPNVVFRFMAKRGTDNFNALLVRGGESFRELLRHKWNLGVDDDQDLDLNNIINDGDADESIMESAGIVWGKLKPRNKRIVLSVVEQIGGPHAADEVLMLLEMQQSW